MIKETWKIIIGFENYKISDLGDVRSLKRNIILKPIKEKNGYLSVVLYDNKKPKRFNIHRLVGIAFIENIENNPVINHKDGNKHNNIYTNLEWTTHNKNNKHAYDLGLKKPTWKGKFGYDHNKSKAVLQYDKFGKYIDEYGSLHEASRILKINVSNIMSVCQGKRNFAGGFIWKYV